MWYSKMYITVYWINNRSCLELGSAIKFLYQFHCQYTKIKNKTICAFLRTKLRIQNVYDSKNGHSILLKFSRYRLLVSVFVKIFLEPDITKKIPKKTSYIAIKVDNNFFPLYIRRKIEEKKLLCKIYDVKHNKILSLKFLLKFQVDYHFFSFFQFSKCIN